MQFNPSVNRVILGASTFMVALANFAFFRNVWSTFDGQPWLHLHVLSLAILQICVLVLILSLLSLRATIKPVLITLFFIAAFTAYFMDTYNVIIDRDMLNNALATDAGESRDLLTPRLLLYVTLLALLPSAVLLKTSIRSETLGAALRSRALLGGGALLVALAVVVLSGSFYASFFREHKVLRYYSNPTTPIYSLYRLATQHKIGASGPLKVIGEDARIPEVDKDRELVILVVGETARADHFSLNGYNRDTNPKLANENVVSLRKMSSCGTSTAISVPCMFAIYDRGDFKVDKADSTENLLDVLNRAGVNLLWRDNSTGSKRVADRIKFEDYRSPETNTICDPECRDEGMLIGLQDYIDQQSSGDILIVLHQMGSHGPAYFKRYPPKIRVFEPTCETSQLNNCSTAEIVNSYDNTILYTDYFLSKVIDLLRANDEGFETAMLYASDHGESLGEAGLYLHGLPYFVAPEAQTQVPAILWLGKNFDGASTEALRQLRDQAFSHDNVYHTVLGLFEVESTVYDPTKDILDRARIHAGVPGEYGNAGD